jgi:hypothetical protein
VRLRRDRHGESRRRAIELVEGELDRLRALGPDGVRALADAPHDVDHAGIVVSTRVSPEHERLLVLVEAWTGRRMLATGGFAMAPDGSTHTPH